MERKNGASSVSFIIRRLVGVAGTPPPPENTAKNSGRYRGCLPQATIRRSAGMKSSTVVPQLRRHRCRLAEWPRIGGRGSFAGESKSFVSRHEFFIDLSQSPSD
jgi:hypothetical protein